MRERDREREEQGDESLERDGTILTEELTAASFSLPRSRHSWDIIHATHAHVF